MNGIVNAKRLKRRGETRGLSMRLRMWECRQDLEVCKGRALHIGRAHARDDASVLIQTRRGRRAGAQTRPHTTRARFKAVLGAKTRARASNGSKGASVRAQTGVTASAGARTTRMAETDGHSRANRPVHAQASGPNWTRVAGNGVAGNDRPAVAFGEVCEQADEGRTP
jgi:hypothetical protein